MSIVLFSGGLDSTVCLYATLSSYPERPTSALFVNYGQRNWREEHAAAREITRDAGVTLYVEPLHAKALESAALCDGNRIVTNENKIVEGRNTLLLTLAAIYAKRLGSERLVIGVTEDDSHDFPDCRPRFIRHMARSLALAFDAHITISIPLAHKLKADVVKMGFALGCEEAMARSWSCYSPKNGEACRECPACLLRIESLA